MLLQYQILVSEAYAQKIVAGQSMNVTTNIFIHIHDIVHTVNTLNTVATNFSHNTLLGHEHVHSY